MQKNFFLITVSSGWVLMFIFFNGCATVKYYNKNYPEEQQSYYFQIDSAECQAIAAGMSPTPQIHINQQSQERTSGRVNIYGSDGYSAHGTYNQNTYYDNSAAQWADIANMSTALGATIRQNNLYEACMCRRGWIRGDSSSKEIVSEPIQPKKNTTVKTPDVSGHRTSSTTPKNSKENKIDLIDKGVFQEPFALYPQLGIGNPIEISPNGKYLLSNNNSVLKLINIENGRELKTYKNFSFLGAGFSPDGNYILNLSYRPQLINTISGKVVQTFNTKANYVFDFAFSSDGKYLALAENNTITLWDLFNGERIRIFEGSSSSIMQVSFGPHDKYIVSWSNAWELKVWDIISGREVNSIQFWNSASFSSSDQKPGGVFDRAVMDISSDGNFMVYAASSIRERFPHKMELWDIIEGKRIKTFDYWAKDIYEVFFTPNNNFICVRIKNSLHFLDMTTGEIAKKINGEFTNICLDNSGTYFIAKEGEINDQKTTLRSFENGKIIRTFIDQLPSVKSIAFSDDGNFLYQVNSDGSVNLKS